MRGDDLDSFDTRAFLVQQGHRVLRDISLDMRLRDTFLLLGGWGSCGHAECPFPVLPANSAVWASRAEEIVFESKN